MRTATPRTLPFPAVADQPLLRPARADELDAVAALLQESYAEHAGALPQPVWSVYAAEIPDVRARLAAAELVVAVSGARLVGTVTFYPDAGRDGHDWPPGGSALRLLATAPVERGHGVGSLLVQECLARARTGGRRFLGLHTAAQMRAGIALYERLRFVREPAYDFDPYAHYAGRPGPRRARGLAYVRWLD